MSIADLTTDALNELTLALQKIGKFIKYTPLNDMLCYLDATFLAAVIFHTSFAALKSWLVIGS